LSVSDKYAADVLELAKVLSLPAVPRRIEGYDVSNAFGHQAVASMVVFAEGEPLKSEYRKFKIKEGQGQADDVRMLSEVLARRFKKDWPHPDLLVIDGGKPQLNAAARFLQKSKLDIALVSISKGEGLRSAQAPDKIFFPGEKKALELPLASPALHLLKRVRDESHRFAIEYHRQLKRKAMFL
jgi:excinuclease ABC subunit C